MDEFADAHFDLLLAEVDHFCDFVHRVLVHINLIGLLILLKNAHRVLEQYGAVLSYTQLELIGVNHQLLSLGLLRI